MSKSSNGYGAGEENGTKVKEPETVTAAKMHLTNILKWLAAKALSSFTMTGISMHDRAVCRARRLFQPSVSH